MKLVDRHACEGTQPVIHIGHRVYRKKDGTKYVSRTWYAEYCHEGRHHQEALRVTNKHQAIRRAHDICRRVEAGQAKPKPYRLLVSELKDQYLELKTNAECAPKTLGKYRFGLTCFADWARDSRRESAVKFGETDFWAFNGWMKVHGASDKTRYDRLVLVKQAFKWAAREKLIPENPLYGISMTKPEANEQPCFTPEQVAVLLEKADPHEAAILATMAYLGLRFGEVRDLRWSNVLWDVGADGFVVIRRGGSGSSTKNNKVRRIPLNPMLKPYLMAIPRRFERVFTARPSEKYPEGGGPIDERRLLMSLKRLCKRCGFADWKKYKLHTFRHTFASMCARNNVAYKYALEWMGHQSSEILDLYYTMYDDVAEAAMRTIAYPMAGPRASADDARGSAA
jgi:integrase